jgi:hypothetical protein
MITEANHQGNKLKHQEQTLQKWNEDQSDCFKEA